MSNQFGTAAAANDERGLDWLVTKFVPAAD